MKTFNYYLCYADDAQSGILRKFLVEETVAQNNIHFAIVITIVDNVFCYIYANEYVYSQ